jgi:hypothetical protein
MKFRNLTPSISLLIILESQTPPNNVPIVVKQNHIIGVSKFSNMTGEAIFINTNVLTLVHTMVLGQSLMNLHERICEMEHAFLATSIKIYSRRFVSQVWF